MLIELEIRHEKIFWEKEMLRLELPSQMEHGIRIFHPDGRRLSRAATQEQQDYPAIKNDSFHMRRS